MEMEPEQITTVLVIGAGPSGLAVSSCLNLLSIANLVIERENCCASLWKQKSYDRLKLHLAKQFCELPHKPFPPRTPTYVPKSGFIQYLDNYTSHFDINPKLCRSVESATYNVAEKNWHVVVLNRLSNVLETYFSKFLVVATSENSKPYIPKVEGIDSFGGTCLHSTQYGNGGNFEGKNVLVVGSGNSGMEIAYDLSNYDVKTSIVIRSPVHVLTKEMVALGMTLLQYLPCSAVDMLMLILSNYKYGDSAFYGVQRPSKGAFYLKAATGRSPVIDVGTMSKIRTGEIEVLPSISKISGNEIKFANAKTKNFDAIIFATGFKSSVWDWLKDGKELFNEDGMPKQKFPNHWKGENGIYCVGFSSRGLSGISSDAKSVANDIHMVLCEYRRLDQRA